MRSELRRRGLGVVAETFEALQVDGAHYLHILGAMLRAEGKAVRKSLDTGMRPSTPAPRRVRIRHARGVANSLGMEFGIPARLLIKVNAAFCNRLQHAITTWISGGRDARRWQDANPALWNAVQVTVAKSSLEVVAGDRGFRTDLYFKDERDPSVENARAAAIRLFLAFTAHPQQDRLRICPECGMFFVAGRADQKYWPSTCARTRTARIAMRRRHATQRDEKLRRVRASIRKLARRTQPPKDRVAWLARHSGIKRTFVTRAVTRGDIELGLPLPSPSKNRTNS
jgi:hypothetical protein